jgi:hypothetical protein
MWEAESRGITVWGQTEQIVVRPPSPE